MKNKAATICELVELYLETRRKLGFILAQEGWALKNLVEFAEQREHQGALTAELAVQWAQSPCSAQPHYWAKRLEIVRRFALFCRAHEPSTQIPPAGLFGPANPRRAVHIYNEEEVKALLAETHNLGAKDGLRVRTFTTLFGLLASSGLRVSEALHLDVRDLDLHLGALRVRQSKGQRERLLPLHSTTLQALRQYNRWTEKTRIRRGQPAFFVFPAGCRLKYDCASLTFRNLRRRLGWTRHPLPRLHDLRHTFAVRSLIDGYRSGLNMERQILVLSTYLGHRRVIDTYWYLSAVPELMAQISACAQERFSKGGLSNG
jgi:integrase